MEGKEMRRNAIVSVMVFAVVAMVAGGISWARGGYGGKVDIQLAPVPHGKTGESGNVSFEESKGGGPIRYQLHVRNVENATMGHIHEVADNGTPGAILAWIYPSKGETPMVREGKFSGALVKGEVTADRLAGPLKGKPTEELFEMLKSGKAGVAIHTKQNPEGELWGFRHTKEQHKS
jgi:hypothetical protein